MKKFMIIGFLSLFFITSNISYSDIENDTLEDEFYSNPSLSDYVNIVYSSVKIKNDELIFRQNFHLSKDSFIELIGDLKSFPKDVTDNKLKVKVVKRDGFPYLFLRKGQHNITGVIALTPEIKKIHVPSYINIIEFSSDDNKHQLIKLSSPYLHIKADNLLENVNDEELFDELIDIANNIDLNLKKVMFHFTLDKF